jgi:Hemerythrin HHE cation binding domain
VAESASVRPDTSDMPAVHKVFRVALASGPEFVASAEGDDDRRALIANYYANVIAFLEAHHDGEEVIIFPRLIERAPDHRTTVDRAARQHAEVVGLMEAVGARLRSWEANGDSEQLEMVRSLAALDDALSPHLDEEEAQILPLAGEYLTAEEWGSLPGHGMANFRGDKIWLIMGLIRENFTQEQRDMMLSTMPPPARQMWESVGEASFDQLIAQVRKPTQT